MLLSHKDARHIHFCKECLGEITEPFWCPKHHNWSAVGHNQRCSINKDTKRCQKHVLYALSDIMAGRVDMPGRRKLKLVIDVSSKSLGWDLMSEDDIKHEISFLLECEQEDDAAEQKEMRKKERQASRKKK